MDDCPAPSDRIEAPALARDGSTRQAGRMDWPVTLALAAALGGFALFCGWRGAQPPDLVRGPRMTPWRLLMVLSAFGLFLLLVHMANLAGMTTGPREPRG